MSFQSRSLTSRSGIKLSGMVLLALFSLLMFSAPLVAQPTDEQPPAEQPPAEPVENKPDPPEEPDAEAAKSPLAKYVIVDSPIDDAVFRTIRNTALRLQELAQLEDRPAFLILEIRPGQSEFHQVHGIAKFLTSSKLDRVRTIAWVPETVTGNNVVVALGCAEIILHPDAELGDIGRGKPVDPDEEQLVLTLVEKRHNVKLSRDLVSGMLNPQVTLLQATIDRDGMTEKRIVTEEQAKVLRDNQIAITNVEVIKDRGQRGIFSGSQARELGVLVTHTIETRAELSNLYGLDPQSLREHREQGESKVVKLIDVTDIIDPVLEAFIGRQIER
ncbi:MAG: hypothetical protein KDA78_09840, partial [Planctomycetaceae bacterium]|nr:hypothetical protein [Planctomycetaceae bacterium]